MKRVFEWAYRVRGLLMAPPYLFLVLSSLGEYEQETVLWTLGLAVFAAGLGLRVWAQMHLHYRLRVRKQLTTTGPYAFVRNPIYIGNTLLLTALAILSEMVWFVPVMLLWCVVVYSLVVRREESHLLEKYGEPYAVFLKTVPRWRPSSRRVNPALMPIRPFFWPSVAAELHCLLWLAPLLGKELLLR